LVNKDKGTCTRPELSADQVGEHSYGKPVTIGADNTLLERPENGGRSALHRPLRQAAAGVR
jgi:hypothetical protein